VGDSGPKETVYREVLESLTEVISRFDSDGTLTYVNDAFCRFFGKTAKQLLGKKWHPVAAPEDVPHIEGQLAELSQQNPVVIVENRVFSGTSEIRWMQFVNHAVFDARGRHLETVSIGRDVTDRRRAEDALHISDAKFRSLFENSIAGISQAHPDGHLIAANDAYAKMFGFASPAELMQEISHVGQQLYAHPDERDGVLRELQRSGFVGPREIETLRRDGSRFFVLTGARSVYGDGGELLYNEAVHIDVTPLKRAQEALRESENQFRSVFENSLDAIFLTTPDGGILDANPTACRMLGRSAEEIRRLGRGGVVDMSDPRTQATLSRRAQDGRVTAECTMIRADGSRFPAEFTSAIFVDTKGAQKTSLIVRDITERRQQENSLRGSRIKLRALVTQTEQALERERRRIAADLHDHVGQILGLAKMKLSTLPDAGARSQGSKTQREIAELLDMAISFSRSLTGELFPPTLGQLGLAPALRALAKKESSRSGTAISLLCSSRVRRVDDETEMFLYRAAQELIRNALRHGRPKRVSISLRHADGFLRLRVADDGAGCDLASAAKHDLPTGFGLFSLRERAEEMGGTVAVKSAPQKGFEVILLAPTVERKG
jgi:PAS domain S-box-containing protein